VAEIRTIAVIGAGAYGRQIVQLSALGGFQTILEDILPASLRRAEEEIRDILARVVDSGQIAAAAVAQALAHIEYASSIEDAARTADLVIEAVPDELESKLEILTLLDKLAKPATVLATTTSSLTVTELGAVTYRAQKILGMRFSPNRLEIIRGSETTDETIHACKQVGQRMGMKIVEIREPTASSSKSGE
jgi:3-hydroxybutyryl-CoA dehydrogenase